MVIGFRLAPDELDNTVDLIVRGVAAKNAPRSEPPVLEEHVAVSEQSLGAGLIEDDTRIDARGNLEGHAAVNVRLDETGHNVRRGTLRGYDKVDTRSTGELRDADDGRLDVLAGDHHEVRELIDDHDEKGHGLRRVVHLGKFA